jgi:glycosyltransferase involved in cell wall biosynthesis
LDVLRFFNVADIFALPSYVEGLPIALLEAMSIGLPSISTNVFAIPEAVIDMKTGLLIEPGRSDQLAAAILKLKREPDLYDRLRTEGTSFVLENFDERDAARKVIDAYERCFENGG